MTVRGLVHWGERHRTTFFNFDAIRSLLDRACTGMKLLHYPGRLAGNIYDKVPSRGRFFMIKSLGEYATDDAIIRLLAKERGKFAVKNGRGRESDNPVYLALKEMLPPRNFWPHPGKVRRLAKPDDQVSAGKTRSKCFMSARLIRTGRAEKRLPSRSRRHSPRTFNLR